MIRPTREGEPLVGGGMCLEHQSGNIYTVVHEVAPMARAASKSSGPAQVATDQFREGWDRIFGSRQPVGEA